MKQKHYIDSHKGATFFYILSLMFIFNNTSNINNINIYIYSITWYLWHIVAFEE